MQSDAGEGPWTTVSGPVPRSWESLGPPLPQRKLALRRPSGQVWWLFAPKFASRAWSSFTGGSSCPLGAPVPLEWTTGATPRSHTDLKTRPHPLCPPFPSGAPQEP